VNRLFRWRGWRDPAEPEHPAARPDAGVHIDVAELIQLRPQSRGLSLQWPQRTAQNGAGMAPARRHGRGIDYQESRNYQPGDDIRTLDWRVTARTGRPHTKLYREERERAVVVVVDLGPSMQFGTRVAFKAVIAARAAALFAWTAVRQGDRIGGFLFGAREHRELRPAGGDAGVLRLLQALAAWTEPPVPTGHGDLSGALRRLRAVLRPGSLIVILSDFPALELEGHLAALRPHHDLLVCRIVDRLELAPPPAGRYALTDGRQVGVIDTRSRSVCDRYADYFNDLQARIERLLKTLAIPLLQLTTDEDVATGLRRGLGQEGRRLRRPAPSQGRQ
jgi:uncharacterized protein (DUF58 family)